MPILRRAPLIHIAREAIAGRTDAGVNLTGVSARGKVRRPNILIDEPEDSQFVVILLDGVDSSGLVGSISVLGAEHPNEPGGLTVVSHSEFTNGVHDSDGLWPSELLEAGEWRTWFGSANLAHVASAGGGTDLMRTRYYTGLDSGVAPCNIVTWSETSGTFTQYSEIYLYQRFGINLAGEHTDYEQEEVLTKLNRFKVADTNGGNRPYLALGPKARGYGFYTTFKIEIHVADANQGGSTNRAGNVDSSNNIGVGTLHEIEVYMKLNDLGSTNGILKAWIDGTLTTDRSDILWRNSTHPDGFMYGSWNGQWGGNTAGLEKTRDDWLYLEQIYISGVAM